MTEQKRVPNEKSPVGAAILSGLCPGVGFFYIGNHIKALAYMLIFASLIVLLAHSRNNEPIAFALMLAAFYIYQIFDSFDEAKKTRYRNVPVETSGEQVDDEPVSLFISVIILIIGIFFQLEVFDIVSFRDISKLWPLILIALGIHFIYNYWAGAKEETNGNSNNYNSSGE